MLDFQALRKQMKDFGAYQLQFYMECESGLQRALDQFEVLKNQDTPWSTDDEEAGRDHLIAAPVDDSPTAYHVAPERPPEMTVVATDGSQIYPDRHREPLWYLVNISRMAFQYGTREAPILKAQPTLFFRGQALEGLDTEQVEVSGRDVVSAVRDELELSALAEVARDARRSDRPLIAMADGTLIRWMLRGIKNPELEQTLLNRYVKVLLSFRDEAISMCSYISMPGNKEFVRLLLHQVYPDREEREQRIKEINDRLFFEKILPPGARSALFQSRSKILSGYDRDVQICFFYVHIHSGAAAGEIARVELPAWIALDRDRVDLIHATVVNEAEKGRGYPMILSEAHEHAVVRGQERTLFYEMIERISVEQGRPVARSLKQRSKERAIL